MLADAGAGHVLRLAFSVPVAALLAAGFGLPLAYIASVLVVTALGPLVAGLTLQLALVTLVLVTSVSAALAFILTPVIGSPVAYLVIVAGLLFGAYRLQGGKLTPVAALAIPLIVLFGPLVPLAAGFAAGLAVLLIAHTASAVLAVILAWIVFPGPSSAPAPADVPLPRSGADCAISAAIMTLLIALALQLDAQSALRLLMIASGVIAVADRGASTRAAGATFAATIAGVGAALLLRNFSFIAVTPTLSALALALIILGIGYRFLRPATAPIAATGLMTILVLMGAGTGVPTGKLVQFTLYTLAGIGIAIGLRHTLLWHFGGRAYRTGA
ncbi:MAG: hypothetical protein ACOYO0_01105 [Sandarakinorhabdus sp.]